MLSVSTETLVKKNKNVIKMKAADVTAFKKYEGMYQVEIKSEDKKGISCVFSNESINYYREN
jgi:hypothetical protein